MVKKFLWLISVITLAGIMQISCGSRNISDYGLADSLAFTNTLGMEFARIDSGTFFMGKSNGVLPIDLLIQEKRRMNYHKKNGDSDEHPRHKVTITQPYFMGITEVTNAQYEEFDPEHKQFRGKNGFSYDDDEPVIYVSWKDAMAFCAWLTKKEGLPYRLPTEAEWEYACRAGTETPYSTGDTLPRAYWRNMGWIWFPGQPPHYPGDAMFYQKYDPTLTDSVKLHVGRTSPNPWGLYDMHGNVEEWCFDTYGPYPAGPQQDPIGTRGGDLKVTRGGSHSTETYYLRSANRSAALPEEDGNWLIGFRVVLGELPRSSYSPDAPQPLHQQNVRQGVPEQLSTKTDQTKPYFKPPTEYVRIASDAAGPIYPEHNHSPDLTICPNGDLLAIWFSTVSEKGREMSVAGSRLRYGEDEWDPASVFWNQADRNNTGCALFTSDAGILYHLNAYSVASTWGALAVMMRYSVNNGYTWSKPRIVLPEYKARQQVIGAEPDKIPDRFVMRCDAGPGGGDGSVLYYSDDKGTTWSDPGGTIRGIHADVVKLHDGKMLAFGRGDNIDGRLPMSVSEDGGQTWDFSPSPFPPISSRQRPVLMRLKEGPLLFISFAGVYGDRERYAMRAIDSNGQEREVHGMYTTLSYDEGKTWEHLKPVWSADLPDSVVSFDGMIESAPELTGYLAAVQGDNNVIHLISSRQYYAFNLAWLETPMK